MLAIPEEPSEMRLWGLPPTFNKDSYFDCFSASYLEDDIAAEVECGQGFDREDIDCWYSESTSAATSVASSEYSDDGLIDIEDEAFDISSSCSYFGGAGLGIKCRESNAAGDTSLGWTGCKTNISQRKQECAKRPSSQIGNIVRKRKTKQDKNCSSRSRKQSPCPCQRLKDRMTFGLSWKDMQSDDQVEAVEFLTRIVSMTMGLREQMEIIRIINPEARVLPTDTEFEIDLDAFNDAKFKRIHQYITEHLSGDSCPLCSESESESCRPTHVDANIAHRKHSQGKTRSTLSTKRISRKSSKHKGILRRVHRQMVKEQKSGLFENEQVISLSAGDKEEAIDVDIDIDILC